MWVERGERELPYQRREAGGLVSVATTRRWRGVSPVELARLSKMDSFSLW